MPETTTCPYCAETIKAAAVVCRFCGRDVKTPLPVVIEELPGSPLLLDVQKMLLDIGLVYTAGKLGVQAQAFDVIRKKYNLQLPKVVTHHQLRKQKERIKNKSFSHVFIIIGCFGLLLVNPLIGIGAFGVYFLFRSKGN